MSTSIQIVPMTITILINLRLINTFTKTDVQWTTGKQIRKFPHAQPFTKNYGNIKKLVIFTLKPTDGQKKKKIQRAGHFTGEMDYVR